jgi:hypothetical protein
VAPQLIFKYRVSRSLLRHTLWQADVVDTLLKLVKDWWQALPLLLTIFSQGQTVGLHWVGIAL